MAVATILLLSGCTGDSSGSGSGSGSGEVPTLEAEWSSEVPSASAGAAHLDPHRRLGPHHWLVHESGTLRLVDARTGEEHAHDVPDGLSPCRLPSTISDDGLAPVLMGEDGGGGESNGPCNRLVVLDAETGDTRWTDELDLSYFTADVVVGADEDVVVVTDAGSGDLCFSARDGEAREPDEAPCTALHDRLTHFDLPLLEDADGNSVDLLPRVTDRREIGRTDEVLLVQDEGAGAQVVRAHDLTTGETLWQDDLTTDPQPGGSDEAAQTYFVTASGVARVSYEGGAEDRILVVTAVDPRTGDDLSVVAHVEGVRFSHQVGEVMVAVTGASDTTVSGFEVPRW